MDALGNWSWSELPRALRPAGLGAAEIADIFWIFVAVCMVVWCLVVLGLLAALFFRRAERTGTHLQPDDRSGERTASLIVIVCVGLTAAVLVALTGLSFVTDRSLASVAGEKSLTIELTGWQWWWQARYADSDPNRVFYTANEIHVPVDAVVTLKLSAGDVIHSFWVPELSGKQDLIPGQQNTQRIVALKAGIYRGQCAEFCGLQHARMALRVIAESPPDFRAWYEKQLAKATEPKSAEARSGKDVFLTRSCVMCHTIVGTLANSKAGPDLTHVASRGTIAAATLPFTRGALGAWIADPQAIKPGSKMPPSNLDPDELNAVIAYLEGLK